MDFESVVPVRAGAPGGLAGGGDRGRGVKRERDDGTAGESDEDEDDGPAPRRGSSKPLSAAQKKKANREKLRRERINDRFAQLAQVRPPGPGRGRTRARPRTPRQPPHASPPTPVPPSPPTRS